MAGCVGSGAGVPDLEEASGAIPASTADILLLLEARCGQQCHRGGAAPKGLSLEPGRALQLLVGVESVEAPGMLRVNPGHPEQSYLISKVAPFDSRRVGSRMPRGGPNYLSNAQVRALKDWIRAGAAPDWQAGQDTEDVLRPSDYEDAGSVDP